MQRKIGIRADAFYTSCSFSSWPLTVAVNPTASLSSEDTNVPPYNRKHVWTLFPGLVSAKSARSVPLAAGWDFPITMTAEHTSPPSLKSLLFQAKLSMELLGISAAGSDPQQQIFPTGCFSFQHPGLWWYLHLGPVISLFHENPLEWDTWHPKIIFFFFGLNWVQRPTVSHWSLKWKDFNSFIRLFFLL